MISKYFYHLTDKKNLKSILENGLIPDIGPNSTLVNETIPAVYLCDRKYIPFWRTLLNKNIILAIDKTAFKNDTIPVIDTRSYSDYNEHICIKPIAPEFIKQIYISKNKDTAANKKLCLSHLEDLSDFCRDCAKFYSYNFKERYCENDRREYEKTLIRKAKALIALLTNLHYEAIDKKTIREYLIDFGSSGEYTLCDTYNHTKTRLYQMLAKYPENDDLKPIRTELYKLIKQKLKGTLNVNTGGWCEY